MKGLLKITMFLVLMTLFAGCCQDNVIEITDDQENLVSDGHTVTVCMNLDIPNVVKFVSRSSAEFQNITLLCFDGEGNLKSSSLASLSEESNTTIKAKIPNSTRVIHLLANQFDESYTYDGIVEESDINALLANPNSMIYWARVEIPTDIKGKDMLAEWLKNQTVSMLRNQAKVKVEVENNKNGDKDFIVTGFAVINTETTGTVAPYRTTSPFYPTHASTTFNLDHWADANYINASSSVLTDANEVQCDATGEINIYETAKDKNASIIIEGYNAFAKDKTPKYWRVAFADGKGKPIDIRRNYLYTVKICGVMPDNCAASDFKSAKTIETSNMAWLLIDDNITAISDTKISLNVEETTILVSEFDAKDDESKYVKATFHIEHIDNTSFIPEQLEVSWVNIQNAEDIVIDYDVESGSNKAVGTIKILREDLALNEGAEILGREGDIVIKYGNRLQRKIKIKAIPKSKFMILKYNDNNVNSSSKVLNLEIPIEKDKYKLNDYTVEDLPIDKLVLSIPENCAAELPFNLLISTNDFNVIGTSIGGYDNKNVYGYKYVYRVTHTGQHIISLRYTQNLVTTNSRLKLEAEHFEDVEINVNYILEN